MQLTKICFWLSVFLIFYPSVIYPCLVCLVAWIRPRPLKRRPWLPSVTVLIPAYNEAQNIAATIQNKLEQDYPSDLLEIMVISDGSTDGTDDIVRELHPNPTHNSISYGHSINRLSFQILEELGHV